MSLLFPLGKGQDPSFEQTLSLFSKDALYHFKLEIGQVVLKKIFKSLQIIFAILFLSPNCA